MATVYDVDPTELINQVAPELKNIIDKPEWTLYVKTGAHKERAPVNKDWWYFRCASILRKIYVMGPIGTQKLRKYYGGKKNRGYKPERFYEGSGSIIRKALRALEKAQLITKSTSAHKGRIPTPNGKSFVDKIASKIMLSKQPKKE